MTMKTSLIIAAMLSAIAFTAQAASITLKDGRVLESPYVLDVKPNGLTIGYKTGCMFANFKNLPESVQKQYNYDPAAAEKYEQERAAAEKEYKHKEAEALAEKARRDKEIDEQLKDADINAMEMNMLDLKSRIGFLKSEIQRMDARQQRDVNTVAKTADAVASTGTVWGGWGTIVKGGQSTQIANRLSVNMTREYRNDEFVLKCYRDELTSKELLLQKTEIRYNAKKAAREKEKAQQK